MKDYLATKEFLLSSGFIPDFILIDRRLIENCRSRCGQYFEYEAYADRDNSVALGVCRDCNLAKVYWVNAFTIALFKKLLTTKKPALARRRFR